VFAAMAGLRSVRCLVTCGATDPFAGQTQRFLAALRGVNGGHTEGGIASGCHDGAFWARAAPAQLQLCAQAPALGPGAA
jgi:hypothetical protein